ncbi:MAG: hypothetical protein AAF198_03305 [Pseudomonadota bacterium]
MLLPYQNAEDQQFRGLPAVFLKILGSVSLIRASAHMWLPDGGAGSIVGLDLSLAGNALISLFAWAGSTQFVWGLTILFVGIWYKRFIPIVLVLVVVENLLQFISIVGPKGSAGSMVAEAYPSMILAISSCLVLLFTLYRSSENLIETLKK